MNSLPLAFEGPQPSARGRSAAAYGLLPSDLARLGVAAAEASFTVLQRPWLWNGSGPALGKQARQVLAEQGIDLPTIAERHLSSDGSCKLLLRLGGDAIEAVHMPRAIGRGRVTLCVSSQVGCAMGCTFCATASMGFQRQLGAGEIVGQVLGVIRELGPRHPSELSLVFMGMGEPLHNLAELTRALGVLCHPVGLGLAARRITVSTSGLVPGIDELGRLPFRPLLALSLNATTDDVRAQLMPVNRRYPLAALRSALERYPLRPREHVTIEYVLLQGINDTLDDAARLADFCAGIPHNINLIPFNEHPRSPFRAPSEQHIDRFARALLDRRPSLLTVRRSRGRDVQAACGQLVQD